MFLKKCIKLLVKRYLTDSSRSSTEIFDSRVFWWSKSGKWARGFDGSFFCHQILARFWRLPFWLSARTIFIRINKKTLFQRGVKLSVKVEILFLQYLVESLDSSRTHVCSSTTSGCCQLASLKCSMMIFARSPGKTSPLEFLSMAFGPRLTNLLDQSAFGWWLVSLFLVWWRIPWFSGHPRGVGRRRWRWKRLRNR